MTAEQLRRLRNDLPMPFVIACLGRDGPPSKIRGGHFRFLCPRCDDMQATVNPRNNLAHCFNCHKSLNNFDLLMLLGHDFLSATPLLEQWLTRFDANRKSRTNSPTAQK